MYYFSYGSRHAIKERRDRTARNIGAETGLLTTIMNVNGRQRFLVLSALPDLPLPLCRPTKRQRLLDLIMAAAVRVVSLGGLLHRVDCSRERDMRHVAGADERDPILSPLIHRRVHWHTWSRTRECGSSSLLSSLFIHLRLGGSRNSKLSTGTLAFYSQLIDYSVADAIWTRSHITTRTHNKAVQQ
jgi:hypothetical protein